MEASPAFSWAGTQRRLRRSRSWNALRRVEQGPLLDSLQWAPVLQSISRARYLNFCCLKGTESLAISDILPFAHCIRNSLLFRDIIQLPWHTKMLFETWAGSLLLCYQGKNVPSNHTTEPGLSLNSPACFSYFECLISLFYHFQDCFPLPVTSPRWKSGRRTTPQDSDLFICSGTFTCQKGCRFISSDQGPWENAEGQSSAPPRLQIPLDSTPGLLFNSWAQNSVSLEMAQPHSEDFFRSVSSSRFYQ